MKNIVQIMELKERDMRRLIISIFEVAKSDLIARGPVSYSLLQ